MGKIIAGFLGVVMVVVIVAGTAYAVFSSTAQVNGLAFSTGNAELQVSKSGSEVSWNSAINYYGDEEDLLLSNLYPGYEGSLVTFYTRNNSNSNISLELKARLVSATGDWGTLANVVQIRMFGDGFDSGWYSLTDWNAAGWPR